MKHPKITLLAHFCRKFNGFIVFYRIFIDENNGTWRHVRAVIILRYFGNKLGLTPNAENMMQIGYIMDKIAQFGSDHLKNQLLDQYLD